MTDDSTAHSCCADFQDQIKRMLEQPLDDLLRPAVNGPSINGDDLLIDTDQIRDDVAYLLACREVDGDPKPPYSDEAAWDQWRADRSARAAELRAEAKDGLLGFAVQLAWRLAPLPDARGVVPVRAWRARDDGAESEAYWSLAYVTPARGLFVRAGNPGLFGEEFAVVSGSGFVIRSGFVTRGAAEDYAVAVAAAVPGIDWRAWTTHTDDAPAPIRDALMAVSRAWTTFGPKGQPA